MILSDYYPIENKKYIVGTSFTDSVIGKYIIGTAASLPEARDLQIQQVYKLTTSYLSRLILSVNMEQEASALYKSLTECRDYKAIHLHITTHYDTYLSFAKDRTQYYSWTNCITSLKNYFDAH